MVTTMGFLRYDLNSSTKRGWQVSRILVAIHVESDPATRNKGLADWATAPSARQSHPLGEEEHLLPLMVVAGAAPNGMGKRVFSDRVLETTLSAFVFQ